jgi:hypothetical protein
MPAPEPLPDNGSRSPAASRKPNHFVWLGPLLVFAAAVSYFLFFVRFPVLRDFPWVNLPLVIVGLLISAVGLWRAFDATRTAWARLLGGFGFGLSLAVASLFGLYIFFLSYQLPETDGVVEVSQAAPDFALLDQNQETVRLSDWRGTKVVLVFYRGHW